MEDQFSSPEAHWSPMATGKQLIFFSKKLSSASRHLCNQWLPFHLSCLLSMTALKGFLINIIKICLVTKNCEVCWHTIPLVSPQCVSMCHIQTCICILLFCFKKKMHCPIALFFTSLSSFPKWSSLMIITRLKIHQWFLVSLQKALRMSSWFSILLKLSYWVSERKILQNISIECPQTLFLLLAMSNQQLFWFQLSSASSCLLLPHLEYAFK